MERERPMPERLFDDGRLFCTGRLRLRLDASIPIPHGSPRQPDRPGCLRPDCPSPRRHVGSAHSAFRGRRRFLLFLMSRTGASRGLHWRSQSSHEKTDPLIALRRAAMTTTNAYVLAAIITLTLGT